MTEYMSDYVDGKWQWMMDYCKKKGIPPAQSWAWDKARDAYDKEHTHAK